MPKLRPLADFVFGHGAVDPVLEQVCTLLERWETSPKSQPELVRSSVVDVLLSADSPHLKDVTLELLQDLVADHPASSARRRGFFKMSRVLAANGFIALVGVWLFGGLRMDEIRRLELECVRWDQATDPDTGETYRVCLLHIPANETTAAFSKPADPIVGELIDAWKGVRPAQPDITDRKTGQRRQHLFCYRAQQCSRGRPPRRRGRPSTGAAAAAPRPTPRPSCCDAQTVWQPRCSVRQRLLIAMALRDDAN